MMLLFRYAALATPLDAIAVCLYALLDAAMLLLRAPHFCRADSAPHAAYAITR